MKINQQKEISKINKQIESLQSKINALSGDYQTNTPKRLREQESRMNKIEGFDQNLKVLEYIKEELTSSDFEENELNYNLLMLSLKAFRDMVHGYRHKYNNGSLQFPSIKNDRAEWYNESQEKEIKRLKSKKIENLEQLKKIVELYVNILKFIDDPKAKELAKLQFEETKLRALSQSGNIHFTPKELIDGMLKHVTLTNDMKVLEPSCGIGDIANEISNIINKDNIDIVELRYDFCEHLRSKGYDNVNCENFLNYVNDIQYDAIVMNPPFSQNQDIKHVKQAFNMLKDGGTLVSVMSPHWTFANDKESIDFRDFMELNGHEWYNNDIEFSHTKINTVTIVINK